MRLQKIMQSQAWFPVLAALIVAASAGCRPNRQSRVRALKLESDRARQTLEDRIEEHRDPHGRAKAALTKLNDSVPDHMPFLISVDLRCTDNNEPMLFFTCLGEDRNLRGIHVREERTDPNGRTTTVEERYPLYIGWPETNVLANHTFPVELRNGRERRDEDAWKDYSVSVLEDLVRKFIYNGPVDETVKQPPNETLDRKIPPIRISLPEPNHVRVSVSAYDREGYESDAVEVGISPRAYARLKRVVHRE